MIVARKSFHPIISDMSNLFHSRVKSLSKGNNSKKDVLSSTFNLKEANSQPPLSSVLTPSSYEDDTDDLWPEQTDKEEYVDDPYEQEKLYSKNLKVESYSFQNVDDKVKRTTGQPKWKDPPKSDMNLSNSNDDLGALLKVNLRNRLARIKAAL